MADREGRKAELERKKARLLAMRAEKNKKEVFILILSRKFNFSAVVKSSRKFLNRLEVLGHLRN